MDPAYYVWLWVLGGGAIVGCFVKPKVILVSMGILFAVAIVGLLASIMLSKETPTWIFGVAAMAIPVLGTVAIVGVYLGAALRGALRRKSED